MLPPTNSQHSLLALVALSCLAPFIQVEAHAVPRAPAVPQSARSIPLLRRGLSQYRTPEQLQKSRLAAQAKYGVTPAGQEKRATGTSQLTNEQFDSLYLGQIFVGTPPSSFFVQLDTGSSDLWVASGLTAQGVSVFNPSSSSSFVNLGTPLQITYGSGPVAGILGRDNVQFAGFEVTNQTFGLVNQVSQGILTAPMSGIMGLAFSNLAASNATPFWQTLAQTSGVLDSPLFAIQITRFSNDTNQNANALQPGGSFSLGVADTSLFTGNIDYQDIPDTTSGFWLQQVASMSVNGKAIALPAGSNAFAAIDSGTTGAVVPDNVLAAIFADIPNSEQIQTGQLAGHYTFPCTTEVTVTLQFGNSSAPSWNIAPIDFIAGQTDANTCVSAFFSLGTGNTGIAPAFIFGDTFLKNVYSVYRFSPPSVGFAALSSKALAINGVEGPAPSSSAPNSAVTVSLNDNGSASVEPTKAGSSGSTASPAASGQTNGGNTSGAGRGVAVSAAYYLMSLALPASVVLLL